MIGAAATGGRRRGGGVSDPTLIIHYDFTAMTSVPAEFTFTSLAGGTYYDVAGVQQTAAANQPRFDHHPTTHEPYGLRFDAATSDTLLRSIAGAGLTTSAGTLAMEYVVPSGINGNLGRVVSLDNGTSDGTERNVSFYTDSAIPQPNYGVVSVYRPAGTTTFTALTTNETADTPNRSAIAYASADAAHYHNGAQMGTSSTIAVPMTVTNLRIGNITAANRPFVGWVRKVWVYNVRKSNTDLATLTTVP